MMNLEYEEQVRAALEPVRAETSRKCGEKIWLRLSVESGPTLVITVDIDVAISRDYRRVSVEGDDKAALDALREGIRRAGRDYEAGKPGDREAATGPGRLPGAQRGSPSA